jgi:hypothetical protein
MLTPLCVLRPLSQLIRGMIANVKFVAMETSERRGCLLNLNRSLVHIPMPPTVRF